MRTITNFKKARIITVIIYTIVFFVMAYIMTDNIISAVLLSIALNIISGMEMWFNRDLYFGKDRGH